MRMKTKQAEDFGQRLLDELNDNKLTQAEFGRQANLTPLQVNNMTRGRRIPSFHNLVKVVNALPNTDVRTLICGKAKEETEEWLPMRLRRGVEDREIE